MLNLKRIINILKKLCVVLLVSVAFFLAITILPVPGNIKFFSVMSGSMEPAIKTGGVVVVSPRSEYKVGDIISFSTVEDKMVSVTHRITRIEQDNYETVYIVKGDGNEFEDSDPVKPNEIIGQVIFTLPWVGFLLGWAKKPIVFTAIVFIPASLVIYNEFQKIFCQLHAVKNREDHKV
ncbi:MAG TPA: signal peptidase I [Candidatus Paceibacterota bacterium]|nr:signal peptidase I [Candidatus Pacearchaeota archaeon]HSA36279.1 signal peptidase I [Candidatus Paceibacterota bacterium]